MTLCNNNVTLRVAVSGSPDFLLSGGSHGLVYIEYRPYQKPIRCKEDVVPCDISTCAQTSSHLFGLQLLDPNS